MITADEPIFPNNVVELLALRFSSIDTDLHIARRPLRNTDPQQSIGVFAQMWSPDDESHEMRGIGAIAPNMPTLQQYLVGVQAFIKHGDEEVGLAIHSVLSGRVRSVLYKDEPLRVALGSLKATYSTGEIESLRRWGVRTQRYFSNEIDAQWLYLSTLEFWIETETR